ncbi:MAG: hypothetical protein IJO28_05465 [Oscillospiraceae bacterium]|nr:hypothetical protein [Oscillospiraceae bacterium]
MKVNTDELYRQTLQFQPMVRKMSELSDGIQQIAKALSRESIGDDFLPVLQQAAARTEAQLMDLEKLRLALEQIAQCYTDCEDRILDRTEIPNMPSIVPGIWNFQWTDVIAPMQWDPWDPE